MKLVKIDNDGRHWYANEDAPTAAAPSEKREPLLACTGQLACTGVVMPLIRCTCVCHKVWDVAFVPWSFRPQDAFQCSGCKKWCKSVQLFRDGDKAPPIEVEA